MKIDATHPVWATTPRGTSFADEVANFLRWRVDGAHFSPSYRRWDKNLGKYVGHWDGYLSLARLTKKSVVFPTGLVPLILEQPWGKKAAVEYADITALDNMDSPGYARTGADLVDLQQSIVDGAALNLRGILQAPTGFGKGRVIGEIIRRFGLPALVICDKVDMLDQSSLAGQIEGIIGQPVGRIGGGTWKEQPTTIATYQTLAKNIDADILREVPLVIVDEVQHAVAKSYQEILQQCMAHIRFGFSAKPFKEWDGDNDRESFLKVQAFLGPFLQQVTMSEGVESGRIVPVDIFIVNGMEWQGRAINYREEYQQGIIENEARNTAILKIAIRCARTLPTVILVESVAHGELLADVLGWPFVDGSTKPKDRAQFYEEFRHGERMGLVISKIGDEALDLPNAMCGILAAGGNATARQTQRIGRFMRAFAGKEEAIVFDFEDFGKYLNKHYRRRRRAYEAEEAYTVTDVSLMEVLTA